MLSHIYNFFEKKYIYKCRLYANEFSFGKNSSMKQTIFSFIPHVCYFSYHPWIVVSESRSLTTQEHQHPCLILLEFQHSSPSSVKTIKTEVDKRILACETLRLTLTFGGVTFKFVVEKIIHHCYCMLMSCFFFSSGFSFTNIHDSRDSRERGRVSI